MKVSVITLHAVRNYGSALQAYATEVIFRRLGAEVETVDYRRRAILHDSLLRTVLAKPGVRGKLEALLRVPSAKKADRVFEGFLRSHLTLTPRRYTDDADFERWPIDADVYCTGSDQVWNTDWHVEIPRPFFLSYAPDGRPKIAFSASFGKAELADWEKEPIRALLERYAAISVREKSALTILDGLGIRGAEHILDPTQFLEPAEWDALASRERIVPAPYILVYQLCNNRAFERYAKALSKKKGIRLIRLCNRYDQMRKPGRGLVLPEVGDFITLIRDADFVLTDSFHCTSFSILFHKRFASFLPSRFGSRVTNVLEMTGLEDRLITDFSDFETMDRPIDYTEADRILDEKRAQGRRFLARAIGAADSE